MVKPASVIACPEEVVVARHLDQLGIGDLGGDVAPLFDFDVGIVQSIETQRRYPDLREQTGHVDVGGPIVESGGRFGAGREPQIASQPSDERLIIGTAWGVVVGDDLRVGPACFECLGFGNALLQGRRPRVVLGAQAFGVAEGEDEPVGSFWMGMGKPDARAPTFGVPEQDCPLRAGGIHHCQHVVHPDVEVG